MRRRPAANQVGAKGPHRVAVVHGDAIGPRNADGPVEEHQVHTESAQTLQLFDFHGLIVRPEHGVADLPLVEAEEGVDDGAFGGLFEDHQRIVRLRRGLQVSDEGSEERVLRGGDDGNGIDDAGVAAGLEGDARTVPLAPGDKPLGLHCGQGVAHRHSAHAVPRGELALRGDTTAIPILVGIDLRAEESAKLSVEQLFPG